MKHLNSYILFLFYFIFIYFILFDFAFLFLFLDFLDDKKTHDMSHDIIS